MSVARPAALKLDWTKVTSSLGLTGATAASLIAFKKRNDDARRKVSEAKNHPSTVDFSHYKSVLKNQSIIAEVEKAFSNFKPVTYDVSKQIAAIESYEALAVENAKETESKVLAELDELEKTLANIETARPFDQLTISDVVAARPDIDDKVTEMVKKGRWEVPGYKDTFGDNAVM